MKGAVFILIFILSTGPYLTNEVLAMDDPLQKLDPALLHKDVQQMTIEELLTIYRIPGADDFAGPELQARGEEARSTLLQLISSEETSLDDLEVMVQVLGLYFYDASTLASLAKLKLRLGSNDEARRIVASIEYWESR